MTALMWASLEGHTTIVKNLVAAGANTDLKQHSGKTVLDLAAEKGHDEILVVLRAAVKS